MATRYIRILGVLVVSFIAVGQLAAADDTPAKPKAPVYTIVGDVVAEISKVDASSITIKVAKVPPLPNINPNDKQYQQKMQQAIQKQQSAPKTYTDTKYDFTPDAQARVQFVPPKLDANGKKISYTPDEAKALKGNPSLPGYKAEISELKVGDKVKVHIVQLPPPKGSDASVKPEQLVRWALIINEPAKAAPNK